MPPYHYALFNYFLRKKFPEVTFLGQRESIVLTILVHIVKFLLERLPQFKFSLGTYENPFSP